MVESIKRSYALYLFQPGQVEERGVHVAMHMEIARADWIAAWESATGFHEDAYVEQIPGESRAWRYMIGKIYVASFVWLPISDPSGSQILAEWPLPPAKSTEPDAVFQALIGAPMFVF